MGLSLSKLHLLRINNEPLTAPTKNWRFSASCDNFVVAQAFVLRLNICGKNRQLLVAANRCGLAARHPTISELSQKKSMM